MNGKNIFRHLNKPLLLLLVLFVFFGCQPFDKKTRFAPEGMVLIPGVKGHKIFYMDASPVTVAQFDAFTKKAQYKTDAEKFGNAGVMNMKTGEWSLVPGANFRYPQGPDKPSAPSNHPVTQVSWHDAVAYAHFYGKRLPTRLEWEFAAANGDPGNQNIYAWGNNWKDADGNFKANFWQGAFPFINTGEDGFLLTSPVGQFGKNKVGLTDMGGNVWQWTSDWKNPAITDSTGEKIQCGGSFLCDPKVCHGFKIGNTASATCETSMFHLGFRCVKDADEQ